MRRYKCDPRWITVRFKGSTCARCKGSIYPGGRAFFYPQGSIALLRRRRLRQSRKPGVFGECVRRGEQHFDVRSNAMYQGDCARCGRKVRSDENYLKAHLWASTAVFHWSCFVALMKEQGETAAEDATWKASRVSRS
jgi:hypothetical protein